MAPIMANTKSRGGKVTNLAPTKGNPLNSGLTKGNPGTKGGPLNGGLQPIPKGNQFPNSGEMNKQLKSRQLKPTLASGTGGNQLQKLAKNRLRGLNG
jgi:hypothetical protein